MNCLNLGCGSRFRSGWTNIDFQSSYEGVIAHNLTLGIPYPDASFDVVYHSHVLEHFSKEAAIAFLNECFRVLHPGGILRVVVPDLEQIARTYLLTLEKADAGCEEWKNHYDWMVLELYDQVVRDRPGGDMMTYLFQEAVPNSDFVVERLGREAKNIIKAGRLQPESRPPESQPKRLLKQVYRLISDRDSRRETLLKLLLKQDYQALQLGRFRQGGEIHQWMYDRYSLKRLLDHCGFENIVQRTASESYVPDWASFNLDTEADGTTYKPDSIFVEAMKPAL